MKSSKTHLYTLFTASCTLILIAAGGLVTSTESGLSVPDWPLSYGQFFPPMVGGVRFEHSHRMIAGFVGILTLVLAVLLWRVEKRVWMKNLGLAALLAVVLQAVLGGITVIYLLPTAVSVFHACLGQTFFTLLTAISVFTSPEWLNAPRETTPAASSLKRLLVVTVTFVYLQLIAGAIVRHVPHATMNYHFALAFLVFIHAYFVLFRIIREPAAQKKLLPHAFFLASAVTLQVFLGLGSFVFTRVLERGDIPTVGEVLLTTAHQAAGALILAGFFTLLLRTFRLYKEPAAPESPSR